MPKLQVKNIWSGPYGVNTLGGSQVIEPGRHIIAEFNDAEAANIRGNKSVFEVTDIGADGKLDTSTKSADPAGDDARARAGKIIELLSGVAYKLGLKQAEELPEAVDKLIAKVEKLEGQLQAIAELFPNTAVEDIAVKIADALTAKAASGDLSTKPTLAEAVASLDDAKPEHWIESGKPNLDVLKELTGNADLKRADVDALTPARVRKT